MIKKSFSMLVIILSTCAVMAGAVSCSKKDPGLFTMKVGAFEVTALLDTSFEMQADLIKNGDPNIIKKYMPEGKAAASVNTYLVKTGSDAILVDAGSGASSMFKGNMLANLKKTGTRPEDITKVFITHAHFDHVAGLLANNDAVFPNAAIYLSSSEMATCTDRALQKLPEAVRPYYEPGNKVLKKYKERLYPFKAGSALQQGITTVDLSGHTPGQIGYLFESEGKKLFIVGDLLHIASLQFPHPEYCLVYDTDIAKAAGKRQEVLGRVAGEKLLIAGMHIPFPGIGHVEQEGKGFRFIPLKQ